MFWNKRMEAIEKRLSNLEQFEKSVSTICDNYFAKNEKKALNFSTGGAADNFYHFVQSVDDKLKRLDTLEEDLQAKDKKILQFTKEVDSLQIDLIAKNREMARATTTNTARRIK